VLLDDGLMELRVVEVQHPRVMCRVARGGCCVEQGHEPAGHPRVSAPALTEKDIRTSSSPVHGRRLRRSVLRAEPRRHPRPALPHLRQRTLIVAKIEKDTALENIEPILALTDAVMVARGDLGVELPFEQVPIAQKRIIQLANLYGRPVITATQMLESMIENPRPTRAEASDVANASSMAPTPSCCPARRPWEVSVPRRGGDGAHRRRDRAHRRLRGGAEVRRADAAPAAHRRDADGARHRRRHGRGGAAARRAGRRDVHTTGGTTRLVSSYRPPVPILGVTDQIKTWRQLALVWGVQPVMCDAEVNYENMLAAPASTCSRTAWRSPASASS
jgi:pyruvate kinase